MEGDRWWATDGAWQVEDDMWWATGVRGGGDRPSPWPPRSGRAAARDYSSRSSPRDSTPAAAGVGAGAGCRVQLQGAVAGVGAVAGCSCRVQLQVQGACAGAGAGYHLGLESPGVLAEGEEGGASHGADHGAGQVPGHRHRQPGGGWRLGKPSNKRPIHNFEAHFLCLKVMEFLVKIRGGGLNTNSIKMRHK